ncbi:acylphosphatase [Acinetobacter sp.]|uniref:acylphosphatase n=1 Tax=Acinetobacter sp. TaxID=472 RepID=UPI002649696A|nr:acylphosphatase [Acinetobacter sp.]MDN5512824.1 acylphosphatase [Acinetobacter sp.]MDN5525188.1 acylphosphatase [Acinetobacter sp.]
MNKAIKLIIHGKVQGVGYRRWFAKQALELELQGYVQNLQTGEVEAMVVGDEQVIQELLKRSWVGPSRAEVSRIIQIPVQPDPNRNDFKILC